MFGTKQDPMSAEILAEITEVKRELASLLGERKAVSEKVKLDEEYIKIKKQLTDKQIEFDREKEKWEREKRETEHMVGLQRKRGEFETEAAGREATLAVREENLKADTKRFEEQMKFTKEHFDQQFESLNNLMEKFLERMPTTKQLINVGSGNGNGASASSED